MTGECFGSGKAGYPHLLHYYQSSLITIVSSVCGTRRDKINQGSHPDIGEPGVEGGREAQDNEFPTPAGSWSPGRSESGLRPWAGRGWGLDAAVAEPSCCQSLSPE